MCLQFSNCDTPAHGMMLFASQAAARAGMAAGRPAATPPPNGSSKTKHEHVHGATNDSSNCGSEAAAGPNVSGNGSTVQRQNDFDPKAAAVTPAKHKQQQQQQRQQPKAMLALPAQQRQDGASQQQQQLPQRLTGPAMQVIAVSALGCHLGNEASASENCASVAAVLSAAALHTECQELIQLCTWLMHPG